MYFVFVFENAFVLEEARISKGFSPNLVTTFGRWSDWPARSQSGVRLSRSTSANSAWVTGSEQAGSWIVALRCEEGTYRYVLHWSKYHPKPRCLAVPASDCQFAPASQHSSLTHLASSHRKDPPGSPYNEWLSSSILRGRMIMNILIIHRQKWHQLGFHAAYRGNTRSISSTPAISPPASSMQHRTRPRGSSPIYRPETLFLSLSAQQGSL